MPEEIFFRLLQGQGVEQEPAAPYWQELAACYNTPGRHYHTLEHLSHMLMQLQQVRAEIKDWDTMLFSLFYHDAVYDVRATDNEAQSASLAEDRMRAISVTDDRIKKCKQQILATKDHRSAADEDTDWFTDADLAILGREWPAYKDYSEKIRLEYAIYPDPVYNAGRKGVLQHFLNMDRIFKTAYFFDHFEKQARLNLQQEYDGL